MTYKVPSYLKFYDSLGMVISESCVAGRKLGVRIRIGFKSGGRTVAMSWNDSWGKGSGQAGGAVSARTFKKGLGIGHVIRKSNES